MGHDLQATDAFQGRLEHYAEVPSWGFETNAFWTRTTGGWKTITSARGVTIAHYIAHDGTAINQPV